MSEGPPTVLLVEDDAKLAELVSDFLTTDGFEVSTCNRGDTAVERIVVEHPDVVILDVMLPGMDGNEVCRRVRSDYSGAVLMLTARGDDIDEVVGLEVGADDFMAKPVRPRVLVARLRSLLRRTRRTATTEQNTRTLKVGRLVLDSGNRTAHFAGRALDLTTAEFDLLWYLASHAGDVLDRDQLYVDLRGFAWDGVDRSIDLRVSRLRRKLGESEVIKSVRGTGYMMVSDP